MLLVIKAEFIINPDMNLSKFPVRQLKDHIHSMNVLIKKIF